MNRLSLLAFTISLGLVVAAVGQDRAAQRSSEPNDSLPLATLGPIEPVPDLRVQLIAQSPAPPLPIAAPNPPTAADSSSQLESGDLWSSGGRSSSAWWARGEVGFWWLKEANCRRW